MSKSIVENSRVFARGAGLNGTEAGVAAPSPLAVSALIAALNRRPALFALMVGLLLTSPALFIGFAQDDWYFLSIFKANEAQGFNSELLNTYTFADGRADGNQELLESGVLPWWAVEGWRVDMWRPLTSLSLWIDYELFGEQPFPFHVHSWLHYGALAALAAVWFRRTLGAGRASVIAALLFAIDGGHGIAAGWIANRHALDTALLGIGALLAHDRSCCTGAEAGTKPIAWRALAISLFFGSLFFGEAGIGALAYIAAYSLFIDERATSRGPIGRAARAAISLWPYLVATAIWRVVYLAAGHGTWGSWLYIDPLAEPLYFLKEALGRYPALLVGLFAAPDSIVWVALPGIWKTLFSAVGAAFTIWMVLVLRPLLRGSREARFLLTGSLLAALPMCATIPQDRNLMFASLGALGVVGLFLDRWARARGESPVRARALAGVWIGAHAIIAPLFLVGMSVAIAAMDRGFQHSNNSVAQFANRDTELVIAVNTPLDLLGASFPLARAAKGAAGDFAWAWLSVARTPISIKRTDTHTLLLTPEEGFLREPWSQIFRRPDSAPMSPGDRVSWNGIEARPIETHEGAPTLVAFSFEYPLEDPRYRFVTWRDGEYAALQIPAIGQSVSTAGVSLASVTRAIYGGPATVACLTENAPQAGGISS
jgi:hypothetical protein